MAGKNRPSFLKRQKEQQRMARASRKREERLARKQGRGLETEAPEGSEAVELPVEDINGSEAEGNGSEAEGEDLPKN